MKKYPKISIITPSYNQGHFIKETIKSVLDQEYPNLEYIIIDGGSTDNTVEVIKKYENQLTYWVSEPDNGQSHAINKGFKIATGEIVNWLNSDDLLAQDALIKIAKAFEANPEAGFIYGKCIEIKGSRLEFYEPDGENDLPTAFYYGFPYAQPSCFYKLELVKELEYLDESFNFTMDYDLFIKIAAQEHFYKIDETLSYFRWHEESKSTNLGDVAKSEKERVFSTLLESLNYKEGISIMKNLGLWQKSAKKYKISNNYLENSDNYPKLVYGFLKPYLIKWHVKGDISKVKPILNFIKLNRQKLKIDNAISRLLRIYSIPGFMIKFIKRIKSIGK